MSFPEMESRIRIILKDDIDIVKVISLKISFTLKGDQNLPRLCPPLITFYIFSSSDI